jgi:hypothetical protein
MDEREWLASDDLGKMLQHLEETSDPGLPPDRWPDESSYYTPRSRRLRLFGCACARQVWHRIPGWQAQSSVSVTEKVVGGVLGTERLKEVWLSVVAAAGHLGGIVDFVSRDWWDQSHDPSRAPERLACRVSAEEGYVWRAICNGVTDEALVGDRPAYLSLLRDVFGNPFRPITLSPAWQTPTILALAEAAYENRSLPAGTLEPDRLAILADALEESGCTDGPLLEHLRGPGPHVRGCFALDAVTGRT